MVVRFVVGAPAVAVHLHEAGLGLLVDLRPTDPSLATLAVDRPALLLDEEDPNQFLTTSTPFFSHKRMIISKQKAVYDHELLDDPRNHIRAAVLASGRVTSG